MLHSGFLRGRREDRELWAGTYRVRQTTYHDRRSATADGDCGTVLVSAWCRVGLRSRPCKSETKKQGMIGITVHWWNGSDYWKRSIFLFLLFDQERSTTDA